jgi:hypothetical protein
MNKSGRMTWAGYVASMVRGKRHNKFQPINFRGWEHSEGLVGDAVEKKLKEIGCQGLGWIPTAQ